MKNVYRCCHQLLWIGLAIGLIDLSHSPGDEIGFIERFALAKDRGAALKELVPGTEDYYYFHSLHYQNLESFDRVDELTRKWVEKFGYTKRVREILNRQALLTFGRDPEKSTNYLKQQLSLNLNHQRENLEGPTLPSILDSRLISRETLTRRALGRYTNTDGFETRALDWLMNSQLEMGDLRHLLERLSYPDHPKTVELIARELKDSRTKGFGAMQIHRNLTKEQLAELEVLLPELRNQQNYVSIVLTKIRPNPDQNEQDDKVRLKQLEEFWGFVKKLSPVHNSLKAHILYHRLALDRKHQVYDRERLLAYLKLPRRSPFTNPDLLKSEQARKYSCDLNANYSGQTQLPPIGDDSQLISDYLQHFFVKEQSYEAFEPYLMTSFLKRQFAETKIVNGLGNPEKWASYISPAEFQALRERVDLSFSYSSRKDFQSDEDVALELYIKNVPKLIVKVFQVNSGNYYRDNQKELDTTIELDGLRPNHEYVFEYSESPFLRRPVSFQLPELKKRGTYIVDFIGNRKSCRALVRKGRLRFIQRITAAGHEIQVVNENHRVVKKASLWIQGRHLNSDQEGVLLLPFSNRPGNYPVVLGDGEIHSLDQLNHLAEAYRLDGGIHVDRESLMGGQKAKLIVRTLLRINGRPTSIKLLKNTRLLITSTDLDGTTSSKEVKDFPLQAVRESVHEFTVPHRLKSLRAELVGEIDNLSQSKPQTVRMVNSFVINNTESEAKVEDLYLSQAKNQYFIDLLGKNGELKVARPVQLRMKHRDFVNPMDISLQTSMNGRVSLGTLDGIDYVEATGPEGTKRKWQLQRNQNRFRSVNVKVGDPIRIPLSARYEKLSRQVVSLFSLVSDRNVIEKDFFDSIRLEDDQLLISDLPAGDYSLRLKDSNRSVAITVSEGTDLNGIVVGSRRLTPRNKQAPVSVQRIERGEDKTTVHLANANAATRVHLIATRFVPRFPALDNLSVNPLNLSAILLPLSGSAYVDGRKIGDEYQYILDRKYADKYPGVMLRRPGLLLQPWAVRSTQTSKQDAKPGSAFDAADDSLARSMEKLEKGAAGNPNQADESSLDFLAAGSVVLLNLPVKDNKVIIANERIGKQQHLHVIALNSYSSSYLNESFEGQELDLANRMFASGLNPDSRFARKKEITLVKAGEKFSLTDIRTGKFEVYDNLPSVYRLFRSLNEDANWVEFGFVLNWRNREFKEKQELYSKYACHELNYFLYRKDEAFFQEVVAPYLRNKVDKTFLDDFLLDNDLSEYQKPWKFSQLNTVERILLARKLKDERQPVARWVSDSYDNQPTPQEQLDRMFRFALSGSALDSSGSELKRSLGRIQEELLGEDRAGLKLGFGADVQAAGNVKPEASARFGRQAGQGNSPSRRPNETSADDLASDGANGIAGKKVKRLESKNGREDNDQDSKGLTLYSVDPGSAKPLDFDFMSKDEWSKLNRARKSARQLFRQVEKTQEWAENNYYKLPIAKQDAQLIKVNQFWNDFASHDPTEPFYSENLAEATGNFTEMMFALSVLDLAWESADHDSKVDQNQIQLTAKSPLLIYHEQIRPAVDGRKETTVLVSQNFFKVGDRYRYEGPDRFDKFVRDEFIKHTAYGCQVVVTNPTSSKQKMDLLLQIPEGSIPVAGTWETRSAHLELDPYRTSSIEYFFYFPDAGEFSHYPVQIAKDEKIIASAEPQKFKVVNAPSKIDRSSWDYLSQFGSDQEVLQYLDNNNLQRINLERIAWRMQEREMFDQVVRKLARNHVFNPAIWAYSFLHVDSTRMSEMIEFRDDFVSVTGAYIDTELLHNDRVARRTYEHLEYEPLVNARVHQLGARREILNDRFHAQYHRLLQILACKRELDSRDAMSLTYYMLLQDRISEARSYFSRCSNGTLQYDYMAAYLDMLNESPDLARQIVKRYSNYQVDRWRKAFQTIERQLNELDGKPTELVKEGERNEVQSSLANNSPAFDFHVASREVNLDYSNLGQVTVNYYEMDVELLFSRNPFVKEVSSELTYVQPKISQVVKLPDGKSKLSWKLPPELGNSNVLVEISNGNQKKTQAYYAHALSVQVLENYGQLKVQQQKSGKLLSKSYCKIYAQMKDGTVRFYKDGYTDLRGRFDYASLSTNDLDHVSRFSILVMNELHGATVAEAIPPKR